MYFLITYDVNTETPEGRRRLRRVAKECCNFGQRVQNSVFECQLSEAQMITLKSKLSSIIDATLDTVRFYNLGNNYSGKIDFIGVRTSYDVNGFLMV